MSETGEYSKGLFVGLRIALEVVENGGNDTGYIVRVLKQLLDKDTKPAPPEAS